MFRILYSVLLPFLTPFFVYWIFWRIVKKTQNPFPIKMLTIIGLFLALIFLFFFSVSDKAPADSIYVPPKFENGKIVPAHMDKRTNEN